jgi:hypothetical protein
VHGARARDYAERGGATEGVVGTVGMDGMGGGSVTLGTAGIGGKVTLGTAGIGGSVTFGTAGMGGKVAAGMAGTAGIGGTVTAGTFGTAGIGGKVVAAGIDGTAPAAGIGGNATVGTGGFGTAGMPGTAATGAAAGVASARIRAAWHVVLPASMRSAITSAVANRPEALEAMTDPDLVPTTCCWQKYLGISRCHRSCLLMIDNAETRVLQDNL